MSQLAEMPFDDEELLSVEGDEIYVRAWKLKRALEMRLAGEDGPYADKPIRYISGHCQPLSPRFLEKLSAGEPSGVLLKKEPVADPLFSVITVCLNAERFIGRAIESVLSQTHHNFEYIIQDGGSIDRTCEIIEEYQKKAQINFVSEPDRATLDGMLKAVKRCRGKYIAVCWADDELLPKALEWAQRRFDRCGTDMIYGDQILANDMNGTLSITRGNEWDDRRFFFNQFYPPFSSAFFSREVLIKLGEILKTFDHDEYEFWCLLDQLGSIRYVPGLVSKFHIHDKTSWLHQGATKHIGKMCVGKKKAVERMAELDMLPYAPETIYSMIELWAATHLMYNTSDFEAITNHLEQAMAGYNGDHRYAIFRHHMHEKIMLAYDQGLLRPLI
jgi:glycosyltransferase involved in cell wall biosynthesis